MDRVDIQEDSWAISRKQRSTTAALLGADYFKDPGELGHPPLGDTDVADPLSGVQYIRPVRVPIGVEQNTGFDKAYRQRLLKIQKVIHSALIKRMRDEGDDISAAKLLSTPRSSVTLRVFFSGMSTSNFCRLDNKEYIEMMRRKLMVPICEPRGNTARCSLC